MTQAPMHSSPTFRLVLSWGLVALWAAFIFFMSAHTGDDFSNGTGPFSVIHRWLDGIQASAFGANVDVVSPIAHFLEYTVFGALMLFALKVSGVERRPAILAIAICSLYAISDELHQLFVPGRECDPIDWIIDFCGVSLGTYLGAIAYNCMNDRNLLQSRDEDNDVLY